GGYTGVELPLIDAAIIGGAAEQIFAPVIQTPDGGVLNAGGIGRRRSVHAAAKTAAAETARQRHAAARVKAIRPRTVSPAAIARRRGSVGKTRRVARRRNVIQITRTRNHIQLLFGAYRGPGNRGIVLPRHNGAALAHQRIAGFRAPAADGSNGAFKEA